MKGTLCNHSMASHKLNLVIWSGKEQRGYWSVSAALVLIILTPGGLDGQQRDNPQTEMVFRLRPLTVFVSLSFLTAASLLVAWSTPCTLQRLHRQANSCSEAHQYISLSEVICVSACREAQARIAGQDRTKSLTHQLYQYLLLSAGGTGWVLPETYKWQPAAHCCQCL